MKHMNIELNNLPQQWEEISNQAYPEIKDYLSSGNYVNSTYIKRFEDAWSAYVSLNYSTLVSSGTSAYKLCLESLELAPQDTCVLLPDNTWASILFVTKKLGYKYDFLDCDTFLQFNTKKLDKWISKNRDKYKNVILVPTHILGHPCDMKTIMTIAVRNDCYVIEDCSQAHGAYCTVGPVGQFSDIAFWSLYPGKNLGGVSQAGIVSTNDINLNNKVRYYTNCGMKEKNVFEVLGENHRPCGISSIVLYHKLNKLEEWTEKRIEIASLYNSYLTTASFEAGYCKRHVYHYYYMLLPRRDILLSSLEASGIPYGINYPFTLSKLDKRRNITNHSNYVSNNIICLPCHHSLQESDVKYISDVVNTVRRWDL